MQKKETGSEFTLRLHCLRLQTSSTKYIKDLKIGSMHTVTQNIELLLGLLDHTNHIHLVNFHQESN